MDVQPQTAQPISDDQALAQALAGVTDEPAMQFEATPAAPATAPAAEAPAPEAPVVTPAGDELPEVKKEAITELRPLVDKLDLPPEEKFDTYLLLIRSTDDKTLIAPAHEAAQAITDEKRRAQALLDIIKEIDYLSQPAGDTPVAPAA